MTDFFTSDLHFCHANVLKLANRPFKTLEEMHEAFIFDWLMKVKKGDRVFVDGDFGLLKLPYTIKNFEKIFAQLPGQKFLIFGNHDSSDTKKLKWADVWDFKSIRSNGQKIFLCHYPMLSWPGMHKGAWHLHGHCHGNLKISFGKMYDVGVDANNYELLSFDDVKKIMDEKEFMVVDHHDGDDEEEAAENDI